MFVIKLILFFLLTTSLVFSTTGIVNSIREDSRITPALLLMFSIATGGLWTFYLFGYPV